MQKNENGMRAIFAVLLMCFEGSVAYAADPPPKTYQIGPQSVSAALKAFASQSDMQLIFTEQDVGSAKTTGVVGTRSPREALSQILKGTGLEFEFTANNVVVVKKASTALATKSSDPPVDGAKDPRKEGKSDSSREFRVGQVDQASVVAQVAQAKEEEPKKKEVLEEIVVTGTHIRDGVSTGSPVITIDQADIARSGFASVRDVILALPQNSGSGMGENTVALPYGNGNNGYAAGANLRGLGSNATLVLLDGHRLAPTGVGGAVDISMIPVSAVERIEVLTDGASATYGSDAVGGVINIITNKHFSGLLTDVQYGSATDGGINEYRATQTAGQEWGSGQFVATYEYYDRGALLGSGRSFSSALPEPTDLTPEAKRNSIVAFGHQNITDTLSGHVDLLYSDQHKSVSDSTQPENAIFTTDDSSQLAVTPGITLALPADWMADISASYGRNSLQDVGDQYEQSILNIGTTRNAVYGGEIRADGTAIRIPGGDIKAAVGVAYRREQFYASGSSGGVPVPTINASRDVDSVYGELSVPLISAGMTSLTHELALSAAARFDRYSDTGSSVTVNAGLKFA